MPFNNGKGLMSKDIVWPFNNIRRLDAILFIQAPTGKRLEHRPRRSRVER